MPTDLKDKRVLITGSSTGIGAAVAKGFAAAGARVVVHYHASAEEAVRQLGGLDVLVNNAGALLRRAPLGEIDDALFEKVVDLNVRAVVMASQAAVPHLKQAGRGSIINTTSIAARNGGGPGSAIYGGSRPSSPASPATWRASWHPRASASTPWRRG